MLKAYRYRLYPTAEQAAFLNRQFGSVRYVYNWALALATTTYQTQGRGITRFQLDKRLTVLKQELPWLQEVASQPLQQALVHLDKAFTRFFREKMGYPRFKSKRGPQSATYPQGVKIQWESGVVYVPKAGWIRTVFSRRFQGTVKTVTVSRVPSGQFFVSVLVEDENPVPDAVPETWERAVGGDLGLHDFLVLSTGETYGHPQWLESELYRLKILQRRLAKTAKGSKNRAKIRRQIARLHERVANRRQDFLHKLSTDLVRRFDTVCVEDLNVAGMARNHALARRIAQSGWAEFRRQLEYKATWSGKHVRVIGRFAPSSRLCPCGYYNHDLTLADRQWDCPTCQRHHDRDVLAANNSKRFAFAEHYTGRDTPGEPGEYPLVDERRKP
ncbi:MAG: transposase [Sulfobacillus acidophilus]|uniref:Transposase n=1 Tax=Sulfobacillus acidophilus TaxID=53633 RepID=A0A2T2WN63_9FIRM|nr:MAG: transposase [Sulfobacillus acidophilus]